MQDHRCPLPIYINLCTLFAQRLFSDNLLHVKKNDLKQPPLPFFSCEVFEVVTHF